MNSTRKKSRSSQSKISGYITETPSVLNWKYIIRELMAGKRFVEWQRTGSLPEYIDVMIREGEDSSLSDVLFREGLDQVAHEADFSLLPDLGKYVLLELISRFVPPSGFLKAADRLLRGTELSDDFALLLRPAPIDLQQKLLDAVSAYFPAAPLNHESPAFRTYVDILHKYQQSTKYSGRVTVELINLEVLHTDSDEFRSLVEKRPYIIPCLVKTLVKAQSRAVRKMDLQNLAFACFQTEEETATELFLKALKEVRGKIVYFELSESYRNFTELVPKSINFDNGELYEFGFTEDEVMAFARRRSEIEDEGLPSIRDLFKKDLPASEIKRAFETHLQRSTTIGGSQIEVFHREIVSSGGSIRLQSEGNPVIRYGKNKKLVLAGNKRVLQKYAAYVIGSSDYDTGFKKLAGIDN
jgi:hypothetical protein